MLLLKRPLSAEGQPQGSLRTCSAFSEFKVTKTGKFFLAPKCSFNRRGDNSNKFWLLCPRCLGWLQVLTMLLLGQRSAERPTVMLTGERRKWDFNLLAGNVNDHMPVTLGLPRKSFESSCSTSFFRGLKNSPRGTCIGSKNRQS